MGWPCVCPVGGKHMAVSHEIPKTHPIENCWFFSLNLEVHYIRVLHFCLPFWQGNRHVNE